MTCHLEDLANQDMSRIDYVLSTVPVNRDLSVPIIMIPNYITDDELRRIESEMRQPRNIYLESFFDERLFFTEIEGKDWQEVIQNICRKMKEKIDLPESFCDAVIHAGSRYLSSDERNLYTQSGRMEVLSMQRKEEQGSYQVSGRYLYRGEEADRRDGGYRSQGRNPFLYAGEALLCPELVQRF